MSSTVEEQVSELKRSLKKLREESNNDDVLDPDDPEVATIVQKLESLQKEHPDKIRVYISDESREWLCQYFKDNYPFLKPDFECESYGFALCRLDPSEVDVLREIYQAINCGIPTVPDESDWWTYKIRIEDQTVELDIKEKWNETTRFDLSRGEFVRDQNEGCGRVESLSLSPNAAVNMTLPTSIEKLTSLTELYLWTPCKSFWCLNPTFFPSVMASMSQLNWITYFINCDVEDDIPASDEVTVANYHPTSDIFPNIHHVDIIDCVTPRRSGGERGEEQHDIDDQFVHFILYQCPNVNDIRLLDATPASIDRLLFETTEWTTNPSNSIMNGPRQENELVVTPPLYFLKRLDLTNLSEARVETLLCDEDWLHSFPSLETIHVNRTNIQTLQPIAFRLAGLSVPSLLPKPKPLSALLAMEQSFLIYQLSLDVKGILMHGPTTTRQKEIDALIFIIQHWGIERFSVADDDDDGNDEQDDNIDANEGENDGDDDDDDDEDEDEDEQYDEIDVDEYYVDDDATANDDDASTDTTTTSSSSEQSLDPKIQTFLELNIAARMWKKMNIDDDTDENSCKNEKNKRRKKAGQTKRKNSPVVYWEYLLEKNSNSPTVLYSLLCATNEDIINRQETSKTDVWFFMPLRCVRRFLRVILRSRGALFSRTCRR
mmetsp:Transcript_2986/g.6717  ORF Transcript_2986/g.6717 Transcript_2986/m.6717 type:complete len:660 (+) Transcript_2986:281-2260(+)